MDAALSDAGFDRVVQGFARDAHTGRLGRGEDALRLGELGYRFDVVRITPCCSCRLKPYNCNIMDLS